MKLEEISAGQRLGGVIPGDGVTVIAVQWHGTDALELTMPPGPTPSRRSPRTAAQRAIFVQRRRDTLEELRATLTAKLGTFANSEEWQAWLKFAAGLHRYSTNNTLVIMLATGGTATAVAGYRAGQAKGRQARAGEQAIRILASVINRVEVKYRHGNPVVEVDGKTRRVDNPVGLEPASAFDVSARDGPPLPQWPEPKLLHGQAPEGLCDALGSIVHDEGYTLTRGDCEGANGWTSFDTHEIRVRDDVDNARAIKTFAREIREVEARAARGLRHPDRGRSAAQSFLELSRTRVHQPDARSGGIL